MTVENWTSEEYRKAPQLNQSKIKAFIEDRDLFYHTYILKNAPVKKEPAHFAFGNMLESLVFYDRIPAIQIPPEMLSDKGRRAGNRYNAWAEEQREEHGEDVRLLTIKEWGTETAGGVVMAREQLKAHPAAAKLIYTPGATIHPRITFELDGQECKAELDIVSSVGAIPDLKTTKCKNRREWMRDFITLKYYVQSAFYQEAWYQETGERLQFFFITVRNTFPFSVEVYIVSDEWIELGIDTVRTAMAQMRICEEADDWSKPDYGEIQELDWPPDWMYQQQEN